MATRHTTFRLDESTLYRLQDLAVLRGTNRTQIVREAAHLYDTMRRLSAHDSFNLCEELIQRYSSGAYLDLHLGSDDADAWRLGYVPVEPRIYDEAVPEIEAFGIAEGGQVAIYIRRRCDQLADLYAPGTAYPLGQIVVGHVLPSEQDVDPDHPDWLPRTIAQFHDRGSRYGVAIDSLRPEEGSEFAPLLASETWTPEGADE